MPVVRSIFICLVAIAASVGCSRSEPAAEAESPPVAPVKAAEAEHQQLAGHADLLGATQALPGHSARISAVVEGHVLSVLEDAEGKKLAEGDRVKKGQVIVRLDDRIIRSNRDKLVASLDDFAEQRKEAQSAIHLAQLDVDRLDRLSPSNSPAGGIPAVSRVEKDKARIALEDAQTKYQAVLAKERGVRADLQSLDLQLEYYQLRAPISGQLGTVQAVPGQTLPIGAVVAELVDLSEVDVLCMAPPSTASRLTVGEPATLLGTFESEDGRPLAGKVVYIGIQAQPETGNFPVKVRFPNPKNQLRANAIVRVEVTTDPAKERLTVREDALLEDQEPPAIITVTGLETKKNAEGHEEKLGKAKKLNALVGVRDRERHLVEILGLVDPEKKTKVSPEGVLFIYEGAHGLHDGDDVKVEEEEKPAVSTEQH